MPEELIGRRICKGACALFIFLGIFLNYYTVSILLYGVNILPASQKIFITAIDVFFISIGYLCWRLRNDFEKQVNFVLLLATIGICLLVTEGVLHVIVPKGISQSAIPLFTESCPIQGFYCNKPNLDIATRVGFQKTTIKTNSFGMPGKEVPLENLGGTTRVALLGDSNTSGFWASSYENSFAGIVSNALGKDHFEVLNFGVSGYGQAQEEMLLKEYVIKFKPSHVVLFFTNSNDMRDNYLGKDMYVITKEGTAVINEKVYKEKMGISGRPAHGARGIKKLLGAIRNSYVYAYGYSFFKESLKLFQKPLDLNNFISSAYWIRTDYTEIGRSAKNETIEKINEIFNFSKGHNISFSIVSVPFYEQVYYKNTSGAGYDMAYPQKYIEDYTLLKRIPYLDLLPPLRDYAKSHPKETLYNEDGLHFNDNGHGAAANLILSFFKDTVLTH